MKKLTGSPAQIIALTSWFVIVLMLATIILLGLPVWFSTLKQICNGTSQECQSLLQLTPAQAAAWSSLDWYAWYNVITRGLARLFSFVLGALIFIRKPNSRIAWVTSIFLIVGIEAGIGASLVRVHPNWLAPNTVLVWIGELSFVLFTLLFPNDRFEPTWTKWIIIPWALLSIANSILPHNSSLGELFGLIYLLFIPLLVGIITYRYRKTFNYVDRQKAKWVIYSFVIGISLFVSGIAVTITIYGFESPVMSPGTYLVQDFLIVGVLDYLLPTSIAISILRYQLFDIDVIIRKTLVYAALTGLLGLMYFGSVTLLQSIFSTLGGAQTPLATVVSTLTIAALFTPLRKRIQDFVDRRFYRRKYDAEKALAQFGAIARSEVDLSRLMSALMTIVKETMEPEHLSITMSSERNDRTYTNK